MVVVVVVVVDAVVVVFVVWLTFGDSCRYSSVKKHNHVHVFISSCNNSRAIMLVQL